MKCLSSSRCGIVRGSLILSVASAFSQGPAFTYQGKLESGGTPVTGLYDFTNALYNASSGGSQVGSTVTLTAVPVTNGLFTVLLDFGSVFNGTAYWLQMGVRSNGVGSYVPLSPRQELTPTPYAITAENLDGTLLASQLTGTLPSGVLSGTYGNALNFNNPADTFTGNGAGLVNVNAASLNGLTSANFWQTAGNAGTTAGVNFLGTTDNQPLELKADATRVLRLEPGLWLGGPLIVPNIIGGSPGNFVGAGTVGNFIGGGSSYAEGSTNYINAGNYNVIGGGWDNHITNSSTYEATIAGGEFNRVGASYGAVGGGNYNAVTGNGGVVPGGSQNIAAGSSGFAAGQNAQALHDGAFVWADDSTSTPFASTGNNQFLARASFFGLNRANPVTGADIFAVRSPSTNGYGGMYIDTAGAAGWPFYGYAQGGVDVAWTYIDASDANKWKLFNNGVQLTVTTGGNVGVGTQTPGAALDVRGDIKLGPAGGLFAAGGNENLRIIRGVVYPSGAIYSGTGFTINHTGTGTYSITFSPAFSDAPALVITAYTAGSPATANCTGGSGTGFSNISTWVGSSLADSWFNFIAVGAR